MDDKGFSDFQCKFDLQPKDLFLRLPYAIRYTLPAIRSRVVVEPALPYRHYSRMVCEFSKLPRIKRLPHPLAKFIRIVMRVGIKVARVKADRRPDAIGALAGELHGIRRGRVLRPDVHDANAPLAGASNHRLAIGVVGGELNMGVRINEAEA